MSVAVAPRSPRFGRPRHASPRLAGDGRVREKPPRLARARPGRPRRARKKRPRLVEIAPSRFARVNGNFTPEEMVMCDVVPNGDGSYRLVPRTWERYERVTSALCRKLGLGERTDTLRRLIRGGFVAGARVAPSVYTINLTSYWKHYERCAEDADYWATAKVRAEYWTAI
jgi:hypothetical protein